MVISGGLGIAKKVFVGDNLSIASGKVYQINGTQIDQSNLLGYLSGTVTVTPTYPAGSTGTTTTVDVVRPYSP